MVYQMAGISHLGFISFGIGEIEVPGAGRLGKIGGVEGQEVERATSLPTSCR